MDLDWSVLRCENLCLPVDQIDELVSSDIPPSELETIMKGKRPFCTPGMTASH